MKAQENLNRHKPGRNNTRSNNSNFFPRNNWQPRNLPRANDPNAMDTSADRVRARLGTAEDTTETVGRGQTPPFPPRGGPRRGGFQGGRRPQRDLRDVICYSCQRPGHLSRNCPQPPQQGWNRQSNRRQPRASNSRAAETDYYEADAPLERTARAQVTPQERANQWLTNVAGEGDEVKDLVLKELYNREGFQDA
jgi:hypothetical protein